MATFNGESSEYEIKTSISSGFQQHLLCSKFEGGLASVALNQYTQQTNSEDSPTCYFSYGTPARYSTSLLLKLFLVLF
jgi:hypothetical protein